MLYDHTEVCMRRVPFNVENAGKNRQLVKNRGKARYWEPKEVVYASYFEKEVSSFGF